MSKIGVQCLKVKRDYEELDRKKIGPLNCYRWKGTRENPEFKGLYYNPYFLIALSPCGVTLHQFRTRTAGVMRKEGAVTTLKGVIYKSPVRYKSPKAEIPHKKYNDWLALNRDWLKFNSLWPIGSLSHTVKY